MELNTSLYVKQYNQKNPQKCILWAARSRAKKAGVKCDLEESDIIIPERCPILDIKLDPVRTPNSRASPSLDRIDNSKGYVKGNVAVISLRANIMKTDMSIEDIRRLYKYAVPSNT